VEANSVNYMPWCIVDLRDRMVFAFKHPDYQRATTQHDALIKALDAFSRGKERYLWR
jgi:hypothetical protein